MPFIPHTPLEIKEMLEKIGVNSISSLFEEIPPHLQQTTSLDVPENLNEMTLARLMEKRAAKDISNLNFIGAGAYEHYIPQAVWQLASRGEWMTSYTPYQAEASQGTLQLLYEYQSMMAELMQMEISNASLYDGASALAEAILMAIRCKALPSHLKAAEKINKKSRISNQSITYTILIPETIHPFYRQVIRTLLAAQPVEFLEIPFCKNKGTTLLSTLESYIKTYTQENNPSNNSSNKQLTALIIPQPNFFGVLEDVDALSQWAQSNQILVIALVNPLSTALLKPPGCYGSFGADIACGEGQPLGIPLASGGPYFGFLCCKKEYIRQLPGRLIGRTSDRNGKQGFTLTLQAREQHIRRAKATSNICTNQGLLVTAATIYMSLLGPEGLNRVAQVSHNNTYYLKKLLKEIPNIKILFDHDNFFHEIVVKLNENVNAETLLKNLSLEGIQAGCALRAFYPDHSEFENTLLICATETKTKEDLEKFSKAFASAINSINSSVNSMNL